MADKSKSVPKPAAKAAPKPAAKPVQKTLNEGFKPVEKGWAPKVQGGFKPSGTVSAKPPTGGSGVKPPPAPKKK